MSEKKQVSRRQFLNYTLTGVGGFMAAGMLAPMVRFAIDPVLQPKAAGGELQAVAQLDEITKEPQRFEWTVEQIDGWYKSEPTKIAWVYYDDNDEIVALEPTCKHLGCLVTWAGSDDHPDQFYCPCHEGRYYKDGVNVKGTAPEAPLDLYEYEERDGTLYLGNLITREGA